MEATADPSVKEPGIEEITISSHARTNENGKYANVLPLERQSKAYKCNGINLSTNTMTNWVIKSSEEYISLLYDRLHELIYDFSVLHADETPVKVMRIDDQKVKGGKETRMWVYRNNPNLSGKPIILFEWQPTRKADHPREFLKGFSGTQVTDGYQVYHTLADLSQSSLNL